MAQIDYKEKCLEEVEKIKAYLITHYPVEKIILFGSLARGVITPQSDIDLCLIMNTNHKRKLLAKLYLNIPSDFSVDLMIYTPEEWKNNLEDSASFASKLIKEGKIIHG